MKRLEVARAVWRAAGQRRRDMNAQLAAAVVHTFKHPMGPRCKAAQVPAAVLILQAEPDAFHNAVKLIARTALVDLLELRQRRLGASN